jgi:hypothetical protein
MVKVSLAVAVYVLVPWVKVVDSGLQQLASTCSGEDDSPYQKVV